MARLHILTGVGPNLFQCVLHEPVPVGNNSVGVPWGTALVNSGLGGATIMPVGNGPGQITPAEAALIETGALFEVAFLFQNNPAWTPTQRNAALDQQIASVSAETQTRLGAALQVFGMTRG